MADKKRILVVTQEFNPYTAKSDIANIARQYAQYLQESGMELRILMPRFGTINERRHRLHEVVRLSGMNITVDDEDYPLIIKVASLPGTRMQVYFLDNDEFFKRKQMFKDAEGKAFDDNMDRMIFFCKGVIETVKKFGWSPDIVHCHGWMTSLLPAYLKNHYKTEPIFQNARFVYSSYDQDIALSEESRKAFHAKVVGNQLEEKVAKAFENGNGLDLMHGASAFADGIISHDADRQFGHTEAPVLKHSEQEEGDWSHFVEFFDSLLLETEEENA
jgi:starch synthase